VCWLQTVALKLKIFPKMEIGTAFSGPSKSPDIPIPILWPKRLISNKYKIIIIIPININSCLYKWNHLISPVIIIRAPIAPIIGQGLLSTKWNDYPTAGITSISPQTEVNDHTASLGVIYGRQSSNCQLSRLELQIRTQLLSFCWVDNSIT
jgi:hypothetical protein